jgi:hypothetical protein
MMCFFNDVLLMDFFMTLNFSYRQMQQLNSCRIYLQVLTLSDITLADGRTLLPPYINGGLVFDRVSRLKWPKQLRPPAAAWTTWKTALAHISMNGKLQQRLGQWTSNSHQQWTWFQHSSQALIYQNTGDQWMEYRPVVPSTVNARTTRQTKIWYNMNNSLSSIPDMTVLVPTTVYRDHLFDDHLFYTSPSQNAIPFASPKSESVSLWDVDDSLHALADTPEFYQRLLGPLPTLNDSDGMVLAHQMELESLLACSDGSFFPEEHTGSHGWVLASTDQQILLQGAGPDDGHPRLMSSYRSELGGLLAVLYTIYRICQHYHVTSGKLRYYCDNKGVLTNVFSPLAPGLAPYLQTDADLVMEAKRLLGIIPITILAEWVKGHYSGKDKEFKHELNDTADNLATSFNRHPQPPFLPQVKPVAPPIMAQDYYTMVLRSLVTYGLLWLCPCIDRILQPIF